MGCSRRFNGDGGFATAAAMVIALAISIIAAALVLRSVTALRLAKQDLHRLQAEYRLAGAQLVAASTVSVRQATQPYEWRLVDPAAVMARAEPEIQKLGFDTAAGADEQFFAAFEVADIPDLRKRLREARVRKVVDVDELDAAPLWRGCASRFVSRYGDAEAPVFSQSTAEPGSPDKPTLRANEIWRVEVQDEEGWIDERIVRLTGSPDRPASVINRKFFKAGRGRVDCDQIAAG